MSKKKISLAFKKAVATLTAASVILFITGVNYAEAALPADGDLPQSGSIVSRWFLDEQSGTRSDNTSTNDLTDNNTVLFGTGISEAGASSTDAADFEADNSESQ